MNSSAPSSLQIDMPCEWRISPHPVPYQAARDNMEKRVTAILQHESRECIWFLEHPPVYTAGRGFSAEDVQDLGDIPLHHIDRGGKITFHGPGQLVGYLMLDLRQRKKDVKHYVAVVEQWIITTLSQLNIPTVQRADAIGVYTPCPQAGSGTAKIAAIGLKLRKWVSYHGFSININPDPLYFKRITPCGLANTPMSCCHDYDPNITRPHLIQTLQQTAPTFFQNLALNAIQERTSN